VKPEEPGSRGGRCAARARREGSGRNLRSSDSAEQGPEGEDGGEGERPCLEGGMGERARDQLGD